ncbi:MAG: hypothetical protein K5894_12010 [Lachnospiraceae bacterium]|nr:hypothetical protein [Lachnospiraceae bacterium]
MKKFLGYFCLTAICAVTAMGCGALGTDETKTAVSTEQIVGSDTVQETPPAETKDEEAPYEIAKVSDYLFETTFYDYEEYYEMARERLEKYRPQLGGCSSIQNGMIRGRNYDWTYDEAPEFVVHVPAKEGRHASVGISTLLSITAKEVESIEKTDLLKLIPYSTVDGINDAGLTVNINVVTFGDKGEFVMKTEDTSDDICPTMICRLLLDKAGSIDEALSIMDEMDIFSLGPKYECHFMISGPQSSQDATFNTIAVELIPDEDNHYQLSIIDNNKNEFVDNKPIMTNFHLTGFDGTEESLTAHPAGYERYLILSECFEQGKTVSGMKDLMKKVYFTKAYDAYSDMIWYSDFTDQEGLTMDGRGEKKISGDYSKAGKFADYYKSEVETYIKNGRKNGTASWHTVHTSVYDIENKILYVIPQEGGFSYDFSFTERIQ